MFNIIMCIYIYNISILYLFRFATSLERLSEGFFCKWGLPYIHTHDDIHTSSHTHIFNLHILTSSHLHVLIITFSKYFNIQYIQYVILNYEMLNCILCSIFYILKFTLYYIFYILYYL